LNDRAIRNEGHGIGTSRMGTGGRLAPPSVLTYISPAGMAPSVDNWTGRYPPRAR
jgi:hypothetical protein